ncbi:MAG: hypothetical protein V1906_00880 [Candidatus Woesearchaeota archaeon]
MSKLYDILLKHEKHKLALRDLGFDEYGIKILGHSHVPLDYVEAIKRQDGNLNATTIYYNYVLGLAANDIDFDVSSKPKALLLYPTKDADDIFSDIELLRQIRETYNIKYRAICGVRDMCRELRDSPALDLLMVAGHGTAQTLTFDDEPFFDQLNINSIIEDRLCKVKEGGVIFLNSCSNGKGREGSRNLANHIAACAPGRKVISCTENFRSDNMTVKSIHPFDINISRVDPFTGDYDDCTYVAVANGDKKR